MKAVSDQQLVQWIADGDASCLGTLFERHHMALYNFMLQMTHNRMLSEDLVQESFMRVLKSARTFRGDASFRCWLFNIARNRFYDHLRKNNRLQPFDESELESPTELEGDPATEFEGFERQAQFQQAMARLPAKQREIIWLGRFELDNFEELGQALGCTAGTARVRMHRAVQQLKDQLSVVMEEPIHA